MEKKQCIVFLILRPQQETKIWDLELKIIYLFIPWTNNRAALAANRDKQTLLENKWIHPVH